MQNREYYEKQLLRLRKDAGIPVNEYQFWHEMQAKSDIDLVHDINNLLVHFNCVPFSSNEMIKLLNIQPTAA